MIGCSTTKHIKRLLITSNTSSLTDYRLLSPEYEKQNVAPILIFVIYSQVQYLGFGKIRKPIMFAPFHAPYVDYV